MINLQIHMLRLHHLATVKVGAAIIHFIALKVKNITV